MTDRDWDILKAWGLGAAGFVGFVLCSLTIAIGAIYICNRIFPDPTPAQRAEKAKISLQQAWYSRCKKALDQGKDDSVPFVLGQGRCYSIAFPAGK